MMAVLPVECQDCTIATEVLQFRDSAVITEDTDTKGLFASEPPL